MISTPGVVSVYVLFKRGKNRLPVLVRHQAHADLGSRACGMTVFSPSPVNPPTDAVGVERRPAACAHESGEARLRLRARWHRTSSHHLRVAGVFSSSPELLVGRRANAVVKAGDRDAPVSSLSSPDDACQGVDRVGRNPTKPSRVEVDCRGRPPPARRRGCLEARVAQGRLSILIETPVPDQDPVGLSFEPFGRRYCRKRLSADLLLALDQEPDVDRRSAGRRRGARQL